MAGRTSFLQSNLQHSAGATSLIGRHIAVMQTNIYLLQEPWVYKGRVRGLGQLGSSLYYKRDSLQNPRACVYVDRRIESHLIAEFCHRDLVALRLLLKDKQGRTKPLVVCSAYLPYDSKDSHPTRELVELVEYCRDRGLPLIVGCDANAHHLVWGSTDTNSRGTCLLEYLNTTDLEILNRGSTPTFVTSRRQEVIDLTLGTFQLVSDVKNWRVSDEPSLSDHRHILFTLDLMHDVGPSSFRNPRTTDWLKYVAKLAEHLGRSPLPCRRHWQVEEAAEFVKQAIIDSYEDSCKLRTHRGQKRTPWWNSGLEKLRRETRRLFNKAMRTKQPTDWEEHKASQRRYKTLIREAKRQSWRTFCEDIEGLPVAAKLHKLLAKDPEQCMGSLKLPSGRFTSTKEEALRWLLETHFPGSEILNTDVPQKLSPHIGVKPMDWKVAAKVVTADTIRWAIGNFSPFKSAGPDGIFPALLQKGLEPLLPHLISLFRASLALGYIPTSWRKVRVAFIPKPGRTSHETAKDFRPISLSSFLLKAVEKMVDVYIRGGILARIPMHPNQHAYRTARSTETALHNLVSRLERGVYSKEVALGVFLDIEGAFNNTSFDSISDSCRTFGLDNTVIRWIQVMLESRIITSSDGIAKVHSTVARGCPQGGVLSPLLWCLVLDGLLRNLNEAGVYAQGYADDLAIVVTGRFPSTIKELMQGALRKVEQWCHTHGLSVNPEKTEVVPFTNKRGVDLNGLTLFGSELRLSKSVKYLGVTIDSRLTWKDHIERIVRRTTASLWMCRRLFGCTWGLKPRVVHWLYTTVIRPMITYGALVWWPAVHKVTYKGQLDRLQRLACLGITGAFKTTPTLALEAILGLEPLHLVVESEARRASVRLNDWGQWTGRQQTRGHTRVWWETIRSESLLIRRDAIPAVTTFYKRYRVILPDREQWLEPNTHLLKPEGLVWFTDGSVTAEGSGAGIYGDKPRVRISHPLGRHSTVFQAEITAITVCVMENLNRGYSGKHIYICTDSRAALLALNSTRVNSALILDCKNTLDRLCESNRVNLVWVPAHCGIEGNENADELAREGSRTAFVGPEPALAIACSTVKAKIRSWTKGQFQTEWHKQAGLRQSRTFIANPLNCNETNRLLTQNRSQLRGLVGVLTGHWLTNYHLHKLRLSNESECRFCSEVDETTEHLVCQCDALVNVRLHTIGDRYLEPMEIWRARPDNVHSFLKRIGLIG